ncbi:hypothetical protein BIV04_05365 [Frigoribacterium sp. MCBA15_019]|nr:hypothetical protein BIV04_05365 [Frigoribacterium sp. MCBA15_019]
MVVPPPDSRITGRTGEKDGDVVVGEPLDVSRPRRGIARRLVGRKQLNGTGSVAPDALEQAERVLARPVSTGEFGESLGAVRQQAREERTGRPGRPLGAGRPQGE